MIEKTSHKIIRLNIKKYLNNRNVKLIELSEKTHINIFALMFLMYYPFSKVKLTNAIKICKILKIELLDILV